MLVSYDGGPAIVRVFVVIEAAALLYCTVAWEWWP